MVEARGKALTPAKGSVKATSCLRGVDSAALPNELQPSIKAAGTGKAELAPFSGFIFGEAGSNLGKSPSAEDAGVNPQCPSCGSVKTWRDGQRWNDEKTARVQRYLCRTCGFRFSEQPLNTQRDIQGSAKYAFEGRETVTEAKNLEPVQKQKGKIFCAGDARNLTADTKGLLTQFYAYLEKEAYSVESDYVDKLKHLAVLGANLRDPEHVKALISQLKRKKDGEKYKNGTKLFYCYAYDAFLKMLKIPWDMPSYTQEDHDPFVPDETELDALINAAKNKELATFLQCLKETFADPGEALRIKWMDVDAQNRAIAIRYPVKSHLTRTLEVSNRLLAMIDALPKKTDRVFSATYASMLRRFVNMRKRTAEVHQNPRLNAVDFTAFRTWAGTMIAYHTNGNVLIVQKLLGHKQIKNTMKYIGKIKFKNDDFETTSACTVEDVLKLGSEGWVEYSVIKINAVEYHCFKKPKRFSTYVPKCS